MTLLIFSREACLRLGCTWLMILAFQSCENPPEVRVERTSPPTFRFSRGTSVDMLLVYHLNADQTDKGIFLDALLADKANISWMIEGEHDQQLPITYGVVPMGMKATVQAKALMEGEYYLVYVASLVGARFVIRNGIAQPVIERQERRQDSARNKGSEDARGDQRTGQA